MIFSLLYGSITHHYITNSLNYCNSVNNYGTIKNEYVIALLGNEKFKAGVISGKDSACGNIFGPITQTNIVKNIDFVAGFYNTNSNDFEELGIRPYSVNGITPVLGINYKLPLYETKQLGLSLNNFVTYDVISHSLGFDIKF